MNWKLVIAILLAAISGVAVLYKQTDIANTLQGRASDLIETAPATAAPASTTAQ